MKKAITLFLLCIAPFLCAWDPIYPPDVVYTQADGSWVDARAHADLPAAVAAIGANTRSLRIYEPIGSAADLVIPPAVDLEFFQDGVINITAGTFTAPPSIKGPDRTLFDTSGGGAINFVAGTRVRSSWFVDLQYALMDTANDRVSLVISEQQTLASSQAVGGDVTLVWESPGNQIVAPSAVVMSNIGQIEAGDFLIFAGAGDFDYQSGITLKSSWFRRLRSAVAQIEDVTLALRITMSETINQDITIHENTALQADPGNELTLGPYDLDIYGLIDVDHFQIFNVNSTGVVTPFVGSTDYIYASWFGDDLQTAIDAATEIRSVLLSPGTFTLTSNVTSPSDVGVYALDGTLVTLGVFDFTISGAFDAGLYQVFNENSTGNVSISDSVRPEWWGAVGDAVVDDALAFQNTADSCTGGDIVLNCGKTYLLETLDVNNRLIGWAEADVGLRGDCESDRPTLYVGDNIGNYHGVIERTGTGHYTRSVSNVIFDGNSANNGILVYDGIHHRNAIRSRGTLYVENCDFNNFNGGWVIFVGATDGVNQTHHITDSVIYNFGNNTVMHDSSAIYSEFGDNVTTGRTIVTDNIFHGGDKAYTCLEIHSSHQLVSDNDFYHWVRVGNSVAFQTVAPTKGVVWQNNLAVECLQGVAIYNIYDGTSGINLQGGVIQGNIFNFEYEEWTITDQDLFCLTPFGVRLSGTSDANLENFTVQNNVFWCSPETYDNFYQVGCATYTASGVSILEHAGTVLSIGSLNVSENKIYNFPGPGLLLTPFDAAADSMFTDSLIVDSNHVVNCGRGLIAPYEGGGFNQYNTAIYVYNRNAVGTSYTDTAFVGRNTVVDDMDRNIRTNRLVWIQSNNNGAGVGTNNEWYLSVNSVMSYLEEFEDIILDGVAMTKGTVGALAVGECGWGENENPNVTGLNSIYIRMPDDSDPNNQDDGDILYRGPNLQAGITIDCSTSTPSIVERNTFQIAHKPKPLMYSLPVYQNVVNNGSYAHIHDTADGRFRWGIGSAHWDFAVLGGATGEIYLDSIVHDNATIVDSWYEVITQPTDVGATATIAIGVDVNDETCIEGATAIAAYTVGLHDGDTDGTVANACTKTTAQRNIILEVFNEDLTAGEIYIYYQYMISE